MTQEAATLEDALRSHMERHGGVVIERLMSAMKKAYNPDAPELQSEEEFKKFIEANSDVFRLTTSVNGVERARLANPRRSSQGFASVASKALEELDATGEESAAPVGAVLDKAVALKKERLADGEEVPYDLQNEEEFLLSARRVNRIQIGDGVLHLAKRTPRPPRKDKTEDGEAKTSRPAKDAGENANPRRRRPQGTPQEPKEIDLPSDVNDSTFIAHLVYKKLCERGAVNIEVGLTTKMLLRLVSMDFKEARPDASPSSMSSLRIFKLLLAEIPGLKRQRPRLAPRPNSRGPRTALEIIVWIENEDEVVECIKAGLPDELANAVVVPDIVENMEELEEGKPQTVNVLDQESWNTSVVGPTSKESVLKDFLEEHKDQAIWAVETEHRVGLRGRPAGNIAVIILSDMHHTIIWDSFQGGFPDCLHEFFSNDKLFKGGIRIAPKVAKLTKQFEAAPVQMAELSHIAHTLGLISDEEKERASMRLMTQNVLQVPVSRPPSVRDSNWELRPMTKAQYKYAVEDGFATALLFMQMVASLHKSNQGSKLNEACISA